MPDTESKILVSIGGVLSVAAGSARQMPPSQMYMRLRTDERVMPLAVIARRTSSSQSLRLPPLLLAVTAACSASESVLWLPCVGEPAGFWLLVSGVSSLSAAAIAASMDLSSSSVGSAGATTVPASLSTLRAFPFSPCGRLALVSTRRSRCAATARASRRLPRTPSWASMASFSLPRSSLPDWGHKTNSRLGFAILMHLRGFPLVLVASATDSMGCSPGFCVSKAKEAVRSLLSAKVAQ
mmetsp:Transcript_45245/g.121805  ORF Transcript_45245/g.121805 Transcript_45245/m.121805 type:complete len:239 (+) Transcript_45245:200-916(+)